MPDFLKNFQAGATMGDYLKGRQKEKKIENVYRQAYKGYDPALAPVEQPGARQEAVQKGLFDQGLVQEGLQAQQQQATAQGQKQSAMFEGMLKDANLQKILAGNEDLLMDITLKRHEAAKKILHQADNPKAYKWAQPLLKELGMEIPKEYTPGVVEYYNKLYNDIKEVRDTKRQAREVDIKEATEGRKGKEFGKTLDWEKEKFYADLGLKEKTAVGGGEREKFKDSFGMRDKFMANQTVKNYNQMRLFKDTMEIEWNRVKKTDPKSKKGISDRLATDQVLIMSFNKILDPGSVVRESEFARTAAGIALKNRLIGGIQKITAGGVGLTDRDRQSLVDSATALMQGFEKTSYKETVRPYYEGSIKAGYDKDVIFPKFTQKLFEEKPFEEKPKDTLGIL